MWGLNIALGHDLGHTPYSPRMWGLNRTGRLAMALYDVIRNLNNLRVKNIISDYAIMGGYAVNYYIEPTYTADVDILVLLKNDDEYHRLYSDLASSGYKIENVYFIINDTPVQFFPSFISSLYKDALEKARRITIQGKSTKIIRLEYLIAFLLTSNRPKDKIRVIELMKKANKDNVREVLTKYETPDAPLNQRLDALLERG